MFYPFKPTKRPSPPRQHDPDAKAAKLIFHKVTAAQRWCAAALAGAFAHMSTRTLKRVWITAGLLYTLMASYLIYQGLTSISPTLFPISPTYFRAPERAYPPASPSQRLLLDQYLDSLDQAILEDSINSIHPSNQQHEKSSQ